MHIEALMGAVCEHNISSSGERILVLLFLVIIFYYHYICSAKFGYCLG